MSSLKDHGTFRRQIPLLDAGLLTEEEERALYEHAEGCADCREIMEVLAAESGKDGGEPGHIPTSLLARWDRVQAVVHGLERDLMARHLTGCETCRQELAAIGHEPVLETDPGEASPRERELPFASPRVVGFDPRHRRRAWFQGSVAGALLAAASMLLVLRPPSPEDAPGALPWVAPGTDRGSVREVALPAGTQRLLLALENPGLTPQEETRLVVTGPSGSTLMDRTLEPEALKRSTVMVVLTVSTGLEEGRYRVTFIAESLEEPVVSTFRVGVTEP